MYGREAVVRLLLAKDSIDLDSKDDYNQTPLSLATKNVCETVVKLLLAKKVVGQVFHDTWLLNNRELKSSHSRLYIEKG